MSKEVIFAGILAVGCLVLVGVAFIAPHKPKPESTEVVKTEAPTETVPPTDLLTGDATGGFAQNTSTGSSFTTTGGASGTSGFTGSTTGGFTGSPASTTGFTGAGTASAFTSGGTTSNAFTGGSSTGSFTSGSTTGSFTGGGSTGGTTSSSTTFGNTPLPTSSEKTHAIAKNETLAEISQKYYGTAKNWKKIVEANPGLEPRSMKVGQKIIIPAVSGTAAAPGEAPTVSGSDRTYTVKSGDSYYTIAKKQLGSANRWKEIEKLNGIGPEELHVGQVIKLPETSTTSSSTGFGETSTTGGTTNGSNEAPTGGKVHVVASGETLSDISKKHFGTTTKWRDIVKANPGVDPETLKVGQKLTIPELPDSVGTGATGSTTGAGLGAATGEYVVKPRDTMQSIAESELGNRSAWKKIVDANPGVDSRNLRVGQKLKIPGKGSTGKAPAQDDTRPSGATTFGGTGTTGGFSATTGGTTGFGTTGSTGSFGGTTTGFTASGTTGGFTSGTTGGFTASGTTGGTSAPRPFTSSGTTSGATTGDSAGRSAAPDRITP